MISDEFFKNIKENSTPATWGKAVEWARAKRVSVERGVGTSEIVFRVSEPGRAVSAKATLLLDDLDWTCDCSSSEDPCCHVLAATLALRRAGESHESLPLFTAQVWAIRYEFSDNNGFLDLCRTLVSPAGDETKPLEFTLTALASGRVAGPPISPSKEDLAVDIALTDNREPVVARKIWQRVFAVLSATEGLLFSGGPIQTSADSAGLDVVVETEGVGVRVKGRRQDGVTQIFKNGVVLRNGVLLLQQDYKLMNADLAILREGRFFGPKEYAELTSEILPRLRGFFPVIEKTSRLPKSEDDPPRLVMEIEKADQSGVRARPRIAYGEPVVAMVDQDRLSFIDQSGTVPTRDRAEELKLVDLCGRLFDVRPNESLTFGPQSAVAFQEKIGRLGVRTMGVSLSSYRQYGPLTPVVEMTATRFSVGFAVKPGGHDVGGQEKHADWGAVWQSWQRGDSMVSLLEGGFAPLPTAFLQSYGSIIQDLMAAKGTKDSLPELLWSDAVALAKKLDVLPPRPFLALKEQLEHFTSLSAIPIEEKWHQILRAYQVDGVRWLRFLRLMNWGGLLADDMGLGKTIQTIAVLERGSLIAAPTSVIWNWQREIERFAPALKVNVYHGAGRSLDSGADVVITSHGTLRADIEVLAKRKWKVMVVDEAQAIKNPDSLLAAAVCQCDAELRLALSGTPVENELGDLWSIFRFLNPGFLGSLADFRDRYAAPIGRGDGVAAARLRERIKPLLLRRRKSDVLRELPLRTEVILKCPLSDHEKGFYQTLLTALRGQLSVKNEVMQILEGILRLRQAACHQSLLRPAAAASGSDPVGSSKTDVLMEKLAEAISEGHKALVFSQWTSFLDLVEPHLTAHQWAFLRIDGSTQNRQEIVDHFQSKDGPPLLIMSLKAGGVGLNLTAADHVFILDPWWNPAAEDQAADRAHRIGQVNPVMIYKLVAEDTIEEKILELQRVKRSLAEAALDGGGGTYEISKNDLLNLIG